MVGIRQRAWWKLTLPARWPELASEKTTERTDTSASRRSPHQHGGDLSTSSQSNMFFSSTGWDRPTSIVVFGACDKVLRIWEVEWGEFSFIGELGLELHPQREWSGMVSFQHTSSSQLSLFQSSSPASSPLPSSCLLSTRFCPILFFTSLTPLPSADV